MDGKDKVLVKMTMNPPEVILSDKWFGNETRLVDISPLEMARQLSLIDYKIFSTIQAKEFLNQAWSKEALKSRSPNLRAMIKRSNDVRKMTTKRTRQTQSKIITDRTPPSSFFLFFSPVNLFHSHRDSARGGAGGSSGHSVAVHRDCRQVL